MASTFHSFVRLPYDIRREIYLLGTPPRVVHVQEDAQPKSEFLENFRRSHNIRLNPDLAYFAPNWRQMINPGSQKQRTLESFGFTSSQGGPHQPWEPSPSTPEITISWLQDHPEIASQLIRENTLYSVAPIPSLLHTWKESRNVLMKWGYMLAFETRTNGPRTWFNFERDVLLIKISEVGEASEYSESSGNSEAIVGDVYEDYLLTACPWSILGQFHSRDLKRVRKLALGPTGTFMCPHHLELSTVPAIQLFPELDVLQIVQWKQEDLLSWRNRGNNGTSLHPWCTNLDSTDCAGELYSVRAQEIDGVLPFLSYFDGIRTDLPLTSQRNLGATLLQHREEFDDDSNFFEHHEANIEERMQDQQDKLFLQARGTETGLSTFAWRVPLVEFVHILPSRLALQLQEEREVAWDKFFTMKDNWEAMEGRNELAPPLGHSALLLNNVQGAEIVGPYRDVQVPREIYLTVRQWWAEGEYVDEPIRQPLF